MTEAQVKAAIHKDFNIPVEKEQTEENPSERTTVLSVTVNDLLEGAGKARISYILGFSTKKLIQVNIVWGNTIDPQAKPEQIVAAANQLRTLFLNSGYDSQTIASNVATADGSITVFQGQDEGQTHDPLAPGKHARAGSLEAARQERGGPPHRRPSVVLLAGLTKSGCLPLEKGPLLRLAARKGPLFLITIVVENKRAGSQRRYWWIKPDAAQPLSVRPANAAIHGWGGSRPSPGGQCGVASVGFLPPRAAPAPHPCPLPPLAGERDCPLYTTDCCIRRARILAIVGALCAFKGSGEAPLGPTVSGSVGTQGSPPRM